MKNPRISDVMTAKRGGQPLILEASDIDEVYINPDGYVLIWLRGDATHILFKVSKIKYGSRGLTIRQLLEALKRKFSL